ncbi:MAG: hypothetical protein AAFQ14_05195 [Cyanobacteria bacterium J06621_12]
MYQVESNLNFDLFNTETALFIINNLHQIDTSDDTFIGRGTSIMSFAIKQNIFRHDIFTKKAALLINELGDFKDTLALAYLSTLTQKKFSSQDVIYMVSKGASHLKKPLHLKYLRGFLEQMQKQNFAPADILYYGIESLKISSNIIDKRIIYQDNYLSVTYGEKNKKNRFGELMIAVQALPHFWTFQHNSDIRIPVKSLRSAKNAVSKWNKISLKGELINDNHSVRISQFLGLKIAGKYAYLNVSRGIGFGKQ